MCRLRYVTLCLHLMCVCVRVSSCTGCVPTRVVLAGLCLLGFVNLYMVRLNLSVSLVAMVHRNTSLNNHSAPCVDTHTKAPLSALMG